jgi:ribosome-binding factor A
MTIQHDRLTSSLLRGVQQRLAKGLQDPRVRGLITVTKVELTNDGTLATIGISVLPAEQQRLTVHGLQSAARHIRRDVADTIRTRTMPEFRFVEDDGMKKQAEVLATLAKARVEMDAKDAKDAAAAEASGEHPSPEASGEASPQGDTTP